jgi:hypothetical protein
MAKLLLLCCCCCCLLLLFPFTHKFLKMSQDSDGSSYSTQSSTEYPSADILPRRLYQSFEVSELEALVAGAAVPVVIPSELSLTIPPIMAGRPVNYAPVAHHEVGGGAAVAQIQVVTPDPVLPFHTPQWQLDLAAASPSGRPRIEDVFPNEINENTDMHWYIIARHCINICAEVCYIKPGRKCYKNAHLKLYNPENYRTFMQTYICLCAILCLSYGFDSQIGIHDSFASMEQLLARDSPEWVFYQT